MKLSSSLGFKNCSPWLIYGITAAGSASVLAATAAETDWARSWQTASLTGPKVGTTVDDIDPAGRNMIIYTVLGLVDFGI